MALFWRGPVRLSGSDDIILVDSIMLAEDNDQCVLALLKGFIADVLVAGSTGKRMPRRYRCLPHDATRDGILRHATACH